MNDKPATYPFVSSSRKRKQNWVKPGFDLQSSITATTGEIIEFAGPSRNGYYYLKNVVFPRKIEITNRYKDGAFFLPEHQELAKQHISRLLDVTNMKLKPSSVGVALISYLDIAEDKFFKNNSTDLVIKRVNHELEHLIAGKLRNPHYSLRAIFIKKAREFIEPDGLVIIEQFSELELAYAQVLGFEIMAYNGIHTDTDGTFYQSVVLQALK